MPQLYRAGAAMLAGVACAAALGCAAPNRVTYLAAASTPPRAFRRHAPEQVDVFLGAAPPRPHVDVGTFETYQGRRADGNPRPTDDVLWTLRLHAALRGCDALQIVGIDSRRRYHSGTLRGVCALYTDAVPPIAVASPAARLSGEGDACLTPGRPVGHARLSCPDPLVCRDGICASPYP
jgi:hypothetical protein